MVPVVLILVVQADETIRFIELRGFWTTLRVQVDDVRKKTTQRLTLFSTLFVQQYVGELQFEAGEETEDETIIVVTRIPSETV